MTTITINRALLEQIVERFETCDCEICTRTSIDDIRAALAAPAAAPEQAFVCSLGCTDECVARAHGVPSECPSLPRQPATAPDRHAQELLAQDITLQNMAERHAQELCAYQVTVDKLRAEIDRLQDQLYRQQASYEAEIKAEIDAALDRAAVACESLGMTTSGIYERNHECASAIRALKGSKE